MITKDNFFDQIKRVDFSTYGAAADDLREGVRFVRNLDAEGIDWKNAPEGSAVAGAVDSLLELLNSRPGHQTPPPAPVAALPVMPPAPDRLDGLGRRPKPKTVNPTHRRGRKKRPYKFESDFISRFVALNGKSRTRAQLETLIDELQEAIRAGKIRKNNPFARDIMFMQTRLIAVVNDMGPREKRDLVIGPDTLKDLGAVVSWAGRIPGEILLENFLKILSGVPAPGTVADLATLTRLSLKNKRVRGKFTEPCKAALSVLEKAKAGKKVRPGKKTLVQVRQALGISQGENTLSGTEPLIRVEKGGDPAVGFRTDQLPDNSHLQIPLTGKWRDLLGAPTKGFSAMVYGKPKQGKSTLVLELCGYLVRAGLGNCLWIELEEDLRTTFKEKVDRLRVGHPDFLAWPEIPESLSAFDFVVINSVSEGKITPDQIRELKKANPDASFILIYHTRKDGEFAGGQEHAHLVDVMVEVKDGRAFANGRFGRGETFVRFTPDQQAPEETTKQAA